jgi:hypothetical protein
VSNGSPSTVSEEAQTTVVMPAARAAAKTWWVQVMLVTKVVVFGTRPGAGTTARWTTPSTRS